MIFLSATHMDFSRFDLGAWVGFGVGMIMLVFSVWAAVRYTFSPGETDRQHIKYLVLGEQRALDVTARLGGDDTAPKGS